MNEVVREFLLETHENLAQLDSDLITLEKDPTERNTLARVFRTLHTVKGTAGFLGLARLQAVSHAGENLLSRLRAGELLFNPDIASALLTVVDAIRRMLAALEASEHEGSGDYSALIQTLERLTHSSADGKSTPLPTPTSLTLPSARPAPPGTTVSLRPATDAPAPEPAEARTPAVSDSAIRVDVGLIDKL